MFFTFFAGKFSCRFFLNVTQLTIFEGASHGRGTNRWYATESVWNISIGTVKSKTMTKKRDINYKDAITEPPSVVCRI